MRAIRRLVGEVLREMSVEFDGCIAAWAVADEQLDYNLLFRWFVGLGLDEPIWAPPD